MFDPDAVQVYAIPMRTRFRGLTLREGVLVSGPRGYGEFCPFDDYDDTAGVSWLRAALEAVTDGWPEPVREAIPVNCTVPAIGPDRAYELVAGSACTTAKVKVADRSDSAAADEERVAAVRAALGPAGRIRVDANAVWDVDTAVERIRRLDRAAGGLEYVEQPCRELAELAAVRRKVAVPIAADESIRLADDPVRVAVAGAADIAVLKCSPLGGVRRALRVAEACGLPCVVSSALETSVGLAASIALAAALPELPYACGLGTRALLDGDVVAGSAELWPSEGRLPVLREAPAPDPDRVAAHRAAPGREHFWRERLARVARLESAAA